MNDKMKCPFCTAELIPGPMERYETLLEHVSDPNGEPSMRITYICKCSTSENCFWGFNGEFFEGDISRGHYGLLSKLKRTAALYSDAWRVENEMEKYREKERSNGYTF